MTRSAVTQDSPVHPLGSPISHAEPAPRTRAPNLPRFFENEPVFACICEHLGNLNFHEKPPEIPSFACISGEIRPELPGRSNGQTMPTRFCSYEHRLFKPEH